MTDSQNPDDLGPEAFEGLGLELLTEGAHATSAQWSAVATDAGRRRQRRSWIVAAAALMVLVVGSATVLLAQTGREGVEVATGSNGSAGPSPAYVLPPADATDVAFAYDPVMQQELTTSFTYVVDGATWTLYLDGSESGVTVPAPERNPLADAAAALGGTPFLTSSVGTVYPLCSQWEQAGPVDDGTTGTTGPARAVNARGPVIGAWRLAEGLRTGRLQPGVPVLQAGDDPCEIESAPTQELRTALERLRPATREEFDTYVADLLDPEPEMAELTTTTSTTSTSSTTTTPTEVDGPADPRSPEEQIVEAVGDWQRRDASGSFVYLEDGTEKAAEYAEMFDLAARQSGADQDDGSVEDSAEVSRLEFVTPSGPASPSSSRPRSRPASTRSGRRVRPSSRTAAGWSPTAPSPTPSAGPASRRWLQRLPLTDRRQQVTQTVTLCLESVIKS